MQSGRFSTPKSYPRSARAETRNRAKDELKRVINAVERVRKWEKRWILLKDSAVYVYKWVPVSGSTPAAKPATTAQKTAALLNERANSAENSNDASNTPSNSHFGLNEESNTAFSEGFESDSNHTSEAAGLAGPSNGASTDFSAMVREETEIKAGPSKLAK